jgi:CRP/FNR family transcriptional regulator
MMRMCEILEMEHINKGETISLKNKEGKSIFFLKSGTVKIVDVVTDHVKYVVKKGNIFGELSLYDNQAAAQEKAIALEDCLVCYIPSHEMEEMMQKHKSLKNGLFKIFGLRVQKLERRLQDLLYKDSNQRIKEFILDYVKEFGELKDDAYVVNNLLSQKDISNLTNTSRQTVSNVLSVLRKEGVIDYNSKQLKVTKTQIG